MVKLFDNYVKYLNVLDILLNLSLYEWSQILLKYLNVIVNHVFI